MFFSGSWSPKRGEKNEVDSFTYREGGAQVLLVHGRLSYRGSIGLTPPSRAEVVPLDAVADAWAFFAALAPKAIERAEDVSHMPRVSRARSIATGRYEPRFEPPHETSASLAVPVTAPEGTIYFEACAGGSSIASRLLGALGGSGRSTFAFAIRFDADPRGYWLPTRIEGPHTDGIVVAQRVHVASPTYVYTRPPHDDTPLGPAVGGTFAEGSIFSTPELRLSGEKNEDLWATEEIPEKYR